MYCQGEDTAHVRSNNENQQCVHVAGVDKRDEFHKKIGGETPD